MTTTTTALGNLRQMCALADEQGIAIVQASDLEAVLDEYDRSRAASCIACSSRDESVLR